MALTCDIDTSAAVSCAASCIRLVESRFTVLAAELTLADHARGIAGTCDLLLRARSSGLVLIGDVKTSGSDAATAARYRGVGYSAQMTAYSLSQPIDAEGRVLGWAGLGLPEPDRSVGVVIHVDRTTAEARLIQVRLDPTLLDQALGIKDTRSRQFASLV